MTETARLVLAADSRQIRGATDDVEKLAKQGKATEGALAGLGRTLVSIGAAYAAGRFFGAIIRNTIEAEQVTAQLTAALKSTGGVAGQTKEALLEHAAALQSVTAFGDEAIVSAQAMLLTFRNIAGDQFPKATEAVLNVAQALGTDLKSAAIQVGKALNDPAIGLTALSRSGITFSVEQQKVIKALQQTGRMAEAQELILAELETQFGGSARAARETLGGALTALQNAFGDLLEGDASSGGVKDATAALEDLTDLLGSQEVKDAFAGITTAVITLAGKLVEATNAGYDFTRWVGEELARAVNGPGLQDLQELDAEIASLEERLAKRKTGLGFGGGPFTSTSDELRAELQMLKERREAAVELAQFEEENRRRLDANKPKPATAEGKPGAPVVVGDPKAGKAAERARREAERAALQAARDYASATGALNDVLNEQASILGGDLMQAAQDYTMTMMDLQAAEDELIRLGKLDEEQQNRLALAREQAGAIYDDTTEAIRAQKTETELLIEDLEFELSLMYMTNAEREKAIALRGLEADATDEQKKRVGELLDAMREEGETIAALDTVRNEFSNFFVDLAKNGEDALDRLQERILDMVLQNLGDQLAESLFGAFGEGAGGALGGGGGGGGGWAAALASFFGGGRAGGGRAARGKFHEVAEKGPELLEVGGKTFLMTGSRDGMITPNEQIVSNQSNDTTNISITVPRDTGRSSAQQLARDLDRELTLARRRS